jgi:hypothetical protein
MYKIKLSILLFVKDVFSPLNVIPVEEIKSFSKELKLFLDRTSIRLSLYIPGSVLEAMVKYTPQEVAWMKARVQEGRLELIGGGFYDSMPPFFPSRLQSLQLKKHRQYITKIFQVEPSGYFNSSMVWEIGMTELLALQSFKYTLVNDDNLQVALGRSTPVFGWFTTEDKGTMLRLISVSTGLSKAFIEKVPFFEEEIQKLPKNDKCVVVSLEVPLDESTSVSSFFTSLEEKLALLDHQTWTVSHVIEQQMTEGKVNLVSALGSNLGLPIGAHSCRELLIRRPEINFLHKSFLAVHRYALEKLSEEDLEKIEEMLLPLMAPFFYRDLYGNQGIKNPGVRWKAYKDLITVLLAVESLESFDGLRIEVSDFLLDGQKQVWVNNSDLSLLIDHGRGAYLRSLNYKPSGVNLINAMRDDGDISVGFLDHFLPNKISSVSGFQSAVEDRSGALTFPCDYEVKRESESVHLLFHSEQIFSSPETKHIFHVDKHFSLHSKHASFDLDYRLTNSTYLDFKGYFGTELELGMRGFDAKTQLMKINGKKISLVDDVPILYPNAEVLELQDRLLAWYTRFEFKRPTRVLLSPIMGMNQFASPQAVQGLRIFFFWDVELSALESDSLGMKIKLSKRRVLL